MFDEVDSPLKPRRPSDQTSLRHKQKKPDIFQNELASKLKERKKLGLAADLTSEESDVDVEKSDLRTRFMKRPQSATKRPDRSPEWHPNHGDHGDTLPHGDGDVSYSRHRTPRHEDNEDREVASFPSVERPGARKQSPTDRTDSGLHGRKTPTGRHTPVNESGGLTKEEMIFGRKTPTEEQKSKGAFFRRKSAAQDVTDSMAYGDSNENRQWEPPTFSKPMTDQRDVHNRTPSPAGSRGRKTPSSLDPISESATPRDDRGDVQARPRLRRQASTSSDKQSPRTLSVDVSPRSDKPTPRPRRNESPKGRTTPTVDIFGKPRRIMDEEEEDVTPKPRRRGSTEQSRTAPSGRRTPVDDGTGSRTRTLPRTGGRSTPTGRKASLEEKPKEEKTQKPASLLSYLTGESESVDTETTAKKSSTRQSISREPSRESLTGKHSRESLTRQRSKDSVTDGTPMLTLQQTKPAADASSVCEEFGKDPQSKARKAHTDSKTKVQRSDRKQADDAICEVADAQMSFIEPDAKGRQKSATKDKTMSKHRPQPRYPTLPGQSPNHTVQNFEDTIAIRQAIYEKWNRERTQEMKKKLLEQKKKEKEEEEKKRKDLEEKEENRVSAFKAWSEKKKETLKEKAQREKEEQRKKEEKEREEKETKIKDMEKTFNSWKEHKDKEIIKKKREQVRQKVEEENEKKYEQREKEKKNSTAFTCWKSKKEIYLKEKAKEEKQKEKETKYVKSAQELKEEEAARKYNEWLEMKEKRDREEKYRQKLLEREHEERPAWFPPSKTVPFGR